MSGWLVGYISSLCFMYRYNLYVDCMPTDDMEEINKVALEKMVKTARSSQQLMESRYSTTCAL